MRTRVKIKKWGNSLGIVLPKKMVEERELKENEEVYVEVFKEVDLSSAFNTLKFEADTQKLKDHARKGWEK